LAPWGGSPGGGLIASVNGGSSWITQTTSGVYYMTDIDMISATEGWSAGYEVYGVIGCTGDPPFTARPFHTSNAGTTWTEVGNVCGFTGQIDFADANRGWLTTRAGLGDGSIFSSGDAGQNWTAQHIGPSVAGLHVGDAGHAWAVGADGAIFRFSTGEPLPLVQFGAPALAVNESDGTVVVTATVSPASALTVTVDYATSNSTAVGGVDYQPVTGTLTFTPAMTSSLVTIPILTDLLVEANETFAVTLSNPQNATLGVPSVAVVTILDDSEGHRLFLPFIRR